MRFSKLDVRVWSWCVAATAVVAIAGASLGPVHVDRPAGQRAIDAGLMAPGAGVVKHERRVDDPPY
jgi:hypothetical protein